MDKTFDPRAVEAHWRQVWESHDWSAPSGSGDPFSIVIPPPNVTGTLHMGHAFQHTIMDALTRYHRMRGDDTLWLPGTDHAGIATQMVVERRLAAEGLKRTTLADTIEASRTAFLEKVWAWKKISGDTITNQIRRMGNSVDWSREAFTMDASYAEAVNEHFVRLYEEGLIYRGKRLVNWDPVLQTAISDLEVEMREQKGSLWHIRYPLADGATYRDEHGIERNYVMVATTRPETMLGDAAVAVHPEDERYLALWNSGAKVELPLCNRTIPIIADGYVEREFGTGAVKITPAHDFNDYAVGQRHDLALLNIFTKDAKLASREGIADFIANTGWQTPGGARPYDHAYFVIPVAYQGLDRFDARKIIIADLDALGLIDKIEEHTNKVPYGDRSGAVIEPYLTDQWFVDLTCDVIPEGRRNAGKPGGKARIANPAIQAVENGTISFVPENWSNTYFSWMRNLQDWCISRQLWWGHRVPGWYDADGNVYVGRSEDEVRAKHPNLQARDGGLPPTLRQDDDVFDTWFSSDLWPLATLGWPQQTPDLAKYYPTSVLVTGFDIIFFWIARMVMMGLHFTDQVPFKEVYVHGLIRDSEGQKMSKSKGNVLDPLDLVDGITLDALINKRTSGLMQPQKAKAIEAATRKEFPAGITPLGVDALRFTFLALASPGRDIRFSAGRAEGYRNFCNKLWNAARFVMMNLESSNDSPLPPEEGQGEGAQLNHGNTVTAKPDLSIADRWIVSRLQRVEAEAALHFASYRFDLLAKTLYEFVWNELCDWYLELSKPAMQSGDTPARAAAQHTVARVLEASLRLLHPLMPFITEEIWQQIAPLAGKAGETIMLAPYPISQPEKINEAAEADVEWLKAFILGVRQIRGEMDVPPGKPLKLLIRDATPEDVERIERMRGLISFVARIELITILLTDEPAPESSTAMLGAMKILVPMAGLIDKDAELARLNKLLIKTESDLAKNEVRLASEKFVGGAPAAVVEKERARVVQQQQEIKTLREQIMRIDAL